MGEWNSANGQLGEPQYPGNPTVLHTPFAKSGRPRTVTVGIEVNLTVQPDSRAVIIPFFCRHRVCRNPCTNPNAIRQYPDWRRWTAKRTRTFPHRQCQLQKSGAFFSPRGHLLSVWRRLQVAERRGGLDSWSAPLGRVEQPRCWRRFRVSLDVNQSPHGRPSGTSTC
jgi:hypothetical protein